MTRFVSRSLATVVLILAAAGANGQEATAAATPANPYTPPACVPGVPFIDITCTTGFDPWIEKFGLDGITAGCGGGKYCPSTPVTRDQMAVFIEKAMHGTAAWSPGDAGNNNTFLGASAGLNTTGNDNTAIGYESLYSNTTGSYNTAIGDYAGVGNANGFMNIFLGPFSDAAANNLTNATAIGYGTLVGASNKVRIGNTNVTVIEGQVAWSWPSDVRLKENIRDLGLGLDFVMQLHPVSFSMKQGNGRTDMGFLAQEVETLLGDGYNVLGIGADKDRTLSLRGTDLIAPLVKAIQEQQAQIGVLETKVAARDLQQAQIDELRAQVQALLAERQAAKPTAQP